MTYACIDVPISSACLSMLLPDVQLGGCLLVPVTHRRLPGAECLTSGGRLWDDSFTIMESDQHCLPGELTWAVIRDTRKHA